MGQHGAAHHIAHCPYAGGVGGTVVVYKDKAALVQVNATVRSQQALGVGAAAHANDQLVEGFLLGAIGRFRR